MKKYEEAKQDYLSGLKYKDIADKYGVSISTVKSWKSRYWKNDDIATKDKQVAKNVAKVAQKIETEKAFDELNNSKLTDKQKAFVLEYIRISNATQAYINVYESTYKTAKTNGPKLLENTGTQNEIKRLRKAKLQELGVDVFDLIQDLAKEARADIGDFLAFGNYDVIETDMNNDVKLDANNEPIISHRSWVQFKDQDKVDTSLIKNISMGKDGPKIELFDRDKARKQLLEYLVQIEAVSNNNQQVILSDSTKERMEINGKD
ncbi:terminase small subunit [Weissella paramesenteroides]|uniref:terminase small subunit n=1 Tax=Weissella paramesenteroides TaxID=1249 RepID=UPI001D17AC11|nr:terminase small subunit [Weissella paramesenteroides]UEG66591.1 terminase small subunit [Weissella hellenica]MCM6765884.1 terminase small subunit [Weissella paramesenteroides]MCM6767273.1 terminase small subunit [Weissella paramesenteroides]MCM6771608.1 terminase small subunit [Weissella paramesenteroides]MCM6779299.1 terminase small subunit [Weissella paramesenteroides]